MATSNRGGSDINDDNGVNGGGVILALDVGSSSVRCSAYDCRDTETLPEVSRLRCLATSRRLRRSVDFQGRIAWKESTSCASDTLLDVLDECVDDVLKQLQGEKHIIMGVGFSTFVMNLVGVNRLGEMVGDDATMSYACQIPDVNAEVEILKR